MIGFTFLNIDLDEKEYSYFEANMEPIRKMTNMKVDIRWNSSESF